MTDLKPCPFCGGKAFAYYSGSPGNGYFSEVICEKCNCRTDRLRGDKAIEVWNGRVENGKKREALTEIKELVDKYWGVDPIYYTGRENTEEAEAARLCRRINEIINSVEDAQTF